MKEYNYLKSCIGSLAGGLGGQEFRSSWYLAGKPIGLDNLGRISEVSAGEVDFSNDSERPSSVGGSKLGGVKKCLNSVSNLTQTGSNRSPSGSKTMSSGTRTMQRSEAVRRRAVRSTANPLNRRSWPLAPGPIRQQLKVSWVSV